MENEKVLEKLKQETEKKIEEVMKQGLQPNNIDMIYSLVDIHKDISTEEYYTMKGELMRYRNYNEGTYNERGRGSYSEGYGARGRGRERDSRGRYKGHEMIDDMYMEYGNYNEGKEQSRRGSYGAKENVTKSLEYMMESVVCFVEMLMEDAESQEEVEIIKHYTKKISEM